MKIIPDPLHLWHLVTEARFLFFTGWWPGTEITNIHIKISFFKGTSPGTMSLVSFIIEQATSTAYNDGSRKQEAPKKKIMSSGKEHVCSRNLWVWMFTSDRSVNPSLPLPCHAMGRESPAGEIRPATQLVGRCIHRQDLNKSHPMN